MESAKNKLLLINPWIYDFAAYDLWSKPLGLLYIASLLRQFQYDISFIDCLDKYGESDRENPKLNKKKYGIGHYQRQIISKPKILDHIPRRYARYGISEEYFVKQLESNIESDAVLLTSIMTYWYPGVKHVVDLCRKYLPGKPIILGGVYASLLPEHAQKVIKPDYIIEGPGEVQILNLLANMFNTEYDNRLIPQNIDDYPYPAFDLINHPDYLIMMTARGCPYNCSFCAQKLISMPFTQRSPKNILEEFKHHYQRYKLRDFAFYDDALFINKKKHIEVILSELIETRMPLRLHSPNGLFASLIDETLAELMFRSNFKTIRLSFETSNESRRADMNSKVSNEDMINAVSHLLRAGYKAKDLEAYVLMGLPNQPIEEIIDSIIFVHNLGIQIRLASFSPIQGTEEFEKAVEQGFIDEDIDPLLTNKTIFPLNNENISYETFRKIRIFSQILNQATQQELSLFKDQSIGSSVRNVVRDINE